MKLNSFLLTAIAVLAISLPTNGQSRKLSPVDRLISILQEPQPKENELAAANALVKKQSEAAIELLRIGQGKLVWPLFIQTQNPSLRSYIIRDAGRSGISAKVIIDRLLIEKDTSAKRGLILSLGSFDSKQLLSDTRNKITPILLGWYRSDPDPGIHSAIDWLLRYGQQGHTDRRLDWQQGKLLDKTDRELAGRSFINKNWFVSKHGQTFVVIHGPVEFMMGTPDYEPGRDKSAAEDFHRQIIPRSFAIATREVTVGQFQQFLDANPAIKNLAQTTGGRKDPSRDGAWMKRMNLDDKSPQVLMTWFEAAQYCNWLSQQEGIPEEEWCYPSLDKIKEGMSLPKEYLHRKGYRMPTEAEWQYACRAGTSSSRFYGQAEELLGEYTWYTGSSFNERPWPGGELKPNDFGLFDMYGNVWEWGQDAWKQYGAPSAANIQIDNEDSILIVSKDYKRPRLGGSYAYPADFMRSGYRYANGYIPDERRDGVGFRLARTID